MKDAPKITRRKLKIHKRNSARGVAALEVALSVGLMIVVVALAVDVTILNYAFTVNDSACRDAVRAMAAQPNPPTGNPLGAANAALIGHKTDGYLISQPALRSGTLQNSASTSTYDTNYPPINWSPPAGQTPSCTCTTFVDVRLPVPLNFWGNNMNTTAANTFTSSGGKIRYTRRYVFPVVNQSTQ